MTSNCFCASGATFITVDPLSRDRLLQIQENEHETRVHRNETKELYRLLKNGQHAGCDYYHDDDDSDLDFYTTTTTTTTTTNSSSMDAIRNAPEIMLLVYSFLPVSDRVSTLARVDKRFAYDTVRSGIRTGRYGPSHMTLSDALFHLLFWISLRYYHNKNTANQERDLAAVNKMIDAIHQLGDLDDHTHDRESRLNNPPHWMEDLVFLERVKVYYLADCDNFNRLEELVREVGFAECFQSHTKEVEGVNPRGQAIARLDPGFVVMLPHSTKGREEHYAVTCSECGKLHKTNYTVRCEHRHQANICKTCDKHAELIHSCSPNRVNDVRCEWGCYECRMKTNRYKVRQFREEIARQAAYNHDFQVGIESMLAEISPDRREQVFQCLLRGQSPRQAFAAPKVCVEFQQQPWRDGEICI
ncbi:hypothetical protein IV203_005105 [Nitzschia inconspicua]|uniref:Uncharacterized protein n=1 Tax=Nitzschia inconspicua TaxID=303405 RepID=A0A9K3KLP1_9STRA|nr:hypothetical protein IV203_005105 [Nitzschia inconspicua]